ncbi:MAG: hypothetical protein V4598_16340 [Bdellovibrionota bacterium]
MKTFFALSLLISFSSFADFSDEHTKICESVEVKKLMGTKGSCQVVLAPNPTVEVSGRCEGKLADITCRVMVLKTSDSASMNLLCGELDSPLLTQVLEAEVLSYNVSALIKTSAGEYVTINDPKEYHVLTNPALDVQLAQGEKINGKMILTLQDRSIPLSDVVCE